MKTVLYISDINPNEPIFHSQVLPHVKGLRNYFEVILLVMSRGEDNVYGYNYKSIPGDYFSGLAYFNFIRNKNSLYKFLEDYKDVKLIYSRGVRGGLLGAMIKKTFYKNRIKMVNDVRSDALDEHKKNYINKYIFHFSIKQVFRDTDFLFFVSSYLKNKYVLRYNFLDKATVFPTFVPNNKFVFSEKIRQSYREKLSYSNNDIVVLYSGNVAKWQNIEIILKSFKSSSNKSIKLLVLTKDLRLIDEIKNNNSKGKIKALSVDYKQIQNYYFAADYGLLIRDDIDTNRCAYPTKFSEYVNSGLPLITTDIPSDYIDILKKRSSKSIIIKKKEDLVQVFSQIQTSQRDEININTLNQIINRQIEFINESIN